MAGGVVDELEIVKVDEDEGEGQYVPISSVRCHIEFPTKGSAMRELELVIVARLAKYGTRERFLHS